MMPNDSSDAEGRARGGPTGAGASDDDGDARAMRETGDEVDEVDDDDDCDATNREDDADGAGGAEASSERRRSRDDDVVGDARGRPRRTGTEDANGG